MSENVDIGIVISVQTPGLVEAVSLLDKLSIGLKNLGAVSSQSANGTSAQKEQIDMLNAAVEESTGTVGRSTRTHRENQQVVDANTAAFEKMRYEMKIFQTAVGFQGQVIRNLSQQVYWWGLGLMFVTMSLGRLEQASMAVNQKTLALANGFNAIADAQKAANEAMSSYGKSSSEYSAAQGKVKQAEYELNLARQQTQFALKQENLAILQVALGAMPLLINSFRMGFDIMATYRSMQVAKIGLSNMEGSATLKNYAIQTLANNALKQGTVVQGANATATQASVMMGYEMVASKVAVKVATDAATYSEIFFQSVVSGGIMLGVSMAAMLALNAWAADNAAAEMKKLDSQAKDLAKTFRGTDVAGSQLNDTLAVHSLDKSAMKVTKAFIEMNDEISNTAKYGNMKVNVAANLDTSKINKNIDVVAKVNAYENLGNIPVKTQGNNQYSFNITFPNLTIREDADMSKLSNTMYKSIMRELQNSGVKPA